MSPGLRVWQDDRYDDPSFAEELNQATERIKADQDISLEELELMAASMREVRLSNGEKSARQNAASAVPDSLRDFLR